MTDELFSTESEKAFLSIILLNPDLIYDVKNVKPFMFSSSPHNILFDTINILVNDGLVPEINLVINYLKSKNKLDSVGGQEYIKHLITQNYNKDNLKYFEKNIVDSYKAKTLISVTSKLSDNFIKEKDVDSVISNLRSTIDNLTLTSGGEGTHRISDTVNITFENIKTRLENPGISGITTGFKSIDIPTGGYCEGEVWIIAGRPSSGKTAFLCNSLLNASKAGAKSLVFDLEMTESGLMDRLIALDTGIPITDIRLGLLDQNKVNDIENSLKRFKDLDIFIDTTFSVDLNYIISTIRKYKKLYDINLVYIDYIGLLAERNSDSVAELGRISRAMKLLANDLKITIIMLSQINRSCELRDDKRPVLSDIRQSGHIEEDSDFVCFLYRDDYYNPKSTNQAGITEFIIRKNRNGPIGTIFLKMNLANNIMTGDK